ncbi:MAG: HAD family hydrolase [Chitinophagales bacterium]
MNWSKKGVKNIIFDLGEVITDIHFEETKAAFEKLTGGDVSELYETKMQTQLFDKLETAEISPEYFLEQLQKYFGKNVTTNQVKDAWNIMIGETPWKRLEFVNDLRPKYKTFILSNTNPIHIDYLNIALKEKYNIENLNPFFDKVYYSHDLGFRKPNAEIYLKVLEKESLLAAETLFIDDRLDNIEAAAKLGIQTFHLVDKGDLFGIE